MKAFINRDTLIDLIKERTVFSRAQDVPEHFRWYPMDGGFLTWDFAMMDKVLVDVQESPLHTICLQSRIRLLLDDYERGLADAMKGQDVEVIAECEGKVEAIEQVIGML